MNFDTNGTPYIEALEHSSKNTCSIWTYVAQCKIVDSLNSVPGQPQSIFSASIDLPMATPFYYNFDKILQKYFACFWDGCTVKNES